MAADVMAGGVSAEQMPGEGAGVVDSVGNLPAPLHSPTVIRKKGVAKAGATTGIKRSASTPNVRSLSEIDTSNMSVAEKRRNKLGYHRTSIACSEWAIFGDRLYRYANCSQVTVAGAKSDACWTRKILTIVVRIAFA